MAQDADTVGTAAIRTEIERTRVELGHTIDEIQERLSPRRVMNEAKETISDATIGRAKRLAHRMSEAVHANGSSPVSTVLEQARRNPALTKLVGVAAGALILAVVARSRRPGLAKSLGGLALSVLMATVAQQTTQGSSRR
jgi:hypothetical protein